MTRPSLAAFTSLVIGALALSVSTAHAEEPPAPRRAAPGLLLAKGRLNLALNVELEMSAGKVGEPVSLSPDVSYGVTDDVTVALIHSLVGTTGFRARAGGGLCLTGTDGGCAKVYNNVGAEGWYQLARGATPMVVGGGLHATNLDKGFYGVKVGVRARRRLGAITLQAAPSVIIAVTEREDDAGLPLNRDTLWIPIQATYQLQPAITVGLGSGVKGPVQGFGDGWQVPLGASVQYAAAPRLGFGLSCVFGALVGGADDPPAPAPAATGLDLRGVQLWVSHTR